MILTYDIETMIKINDKYKMGLGYKDYILVGLYDGKKYKQFNSLEQMLYFIYEKYKEVIYLYGHNAGKYDNLYLLDAIKNIRISRCNIEIKNLIVINSNLNYDIKFSNRKIVKVRDSIQLMPASLDNLLSSYNITTQKLKMNYSKLYEWHEIEKYLYNDVVGLHKLLKTFEIDINNILKDKKINIEKFRTIASLSFNILKNRYLDGGLRNYMTKEHEDYIRNAYHGGRVEVFKRHGYNLNYYDVNSLYPFVMANYEYPTGKHFFTNNPLAYYRHLLGVCKVKVYYPYQNITMLPHKLDKLYFSYGIWTDYYTTPEIIKAESLGVKFKFISGIFWTKRENLFSKFVNDFYKMKVNSTGSKKQIAKLILNSCYGKFGQKRFTDEIISEQEAYEKGFKINEYEKLGSYYTRKKISYKNRYINPIYAIFITAYARLYMFRFIEKLGFSNIVYMDTDSIVTEKTLPDCYISENEIGKFKLEHSIKEGIFISNKLYAFMKNDYEYIFKLRGMDKDTRENMTFKKFKSILNDNFSFKKKRLLSFKENFRRININHDSFVNTVYSTKKINSKYDKRILHDDYSEPIFIKDDLSTSLP